MAQTGPGAFDALQQEFADALIGHRACQWEAGDVAARALAACGTRNERATIARALASLGHCTAQYVQQLAQVAQAFNPTLRLPDVAWSLYRACVQAAGRKGTGTADQFFVLAMSQGWHCKEVNALGKPAKDTVAPCPTCGRASA